MIAAPALPPEEVLGMRADLALAILAGRSSLMTHPGTTGTPAPGSAPGANGYSGMASGGYGTSGGRVVRITTMDELKQFLGR